MLIQAIIHRWVKDHKNVADGKVREAYVVLSGILGILCNLVLFIIKLAIGLSINSIAVISDAFNNMTDLGSSLVSILGAKLSNQPPDKDHPYGHGRYEYIASLVVAFLIFSVGWELLSTSYNKLLHPEKVVYSPAILVILVVSVLVKLWMFSYNMHIARKINSSINKAVAYDSINDGIATGLVIISMILGAFTDFPVDGAAGMLISLFILYAGFNVARDTVTLLLGHAPDPELVYRINELVASGKHVIGTHDLEVHDYGPSRVIASIHVEVPDYLNIVEVHASIDTLESLIIEELGIPITIHMDPISTDTEKIARVRKDIDTYIEGMDMGIRLGKFRIAQAEKKINVIFDLEVLPTLPVSEYSQLKKFIRNGIQTRYSNYEVVINEIYSCQGDGRPCENQP